MKYVLSVDIGTTALKSCIVGSDGTIIASEVDEYPLIANGVQMEQDPHLWWHAFCITTKKLMTHYSHISLEAVVLSGQMQDVICIEEGKVVGNAILYSDTRAGKEFEQYVHALGRTHIMEVTHNAPDVSSLPPKLIYKSVDKQTKILLGAHDFICWKLTGMMITDVTNASTTGLMDYKKGEWSSEILDYIGISSSQLPSIEHAGTISGSILSHAALESSLPSGLPVIHGSGDAGASTVGVGAADDRVVSCYLGTSGWLAATITHPIDPALGVFNLQHPDGKQTISIGAMRTTGGNISWLLDTFTLTENRYTAYQEIARQAPVGSKGLFYLPYLQGERMPFNDPHARGAFIGLTRDTGKAEMFRSVIEGIAYAYATIYEVLRTASSDNVVKIVASGGGAKNSLLVQTLANVIGLPVYIVSEPAHSGVLGNVVIARKALGWGDSYNLPEAWSHYDAIFYCDEIAHQTYQKSYGVFKRLYDSLKHEFGNIANL